MKHFILFNICMMWMILRKLLTRHTWHDKVQSQRRLKSLYPEMLCRWIKSPFVAHLYPYHPGACEEVKNNKDLKNWGQDHHELLYFYSNKPPGSNLSLCQASFVSAVLSASLGRKELTLCSTRGPCASLQCTQLVPFHHTHSKHIQTLL